MESVTELQIVYCCRALISDRTGCNSAGAAPPLWSAAKLLTVLTINYCRWALQLELPLPNSGRSHPSGLLLFKAFSGRCAASGDFLPQSPRFESRPGFLGESWDRGQGAGSVWEVCSRAMCPWSRGCACRCLPWLLCWSAAWSGAASRRGQGAPRALAGGGELNRGRDGGSECRCRGGEQSERCLRLRALRWVSFPPDPNLPTFLSLPKILPLCRLAL